MTVLIRFGSVSKFNASLHDLTVLLFCCLLLSISCDAAAVIPTGDYYVGIFVHLARVDTLMGVGQGGSGALAFMQVTKRALSDSRGRRPAGEERGVSGAVAVADSLVLPSPVPKSIEWESRIM